MRILRFAAAAATMICLTAGAAQAHPLTTFATFHSIGDDPTIQWVQGADLHSGAFVQPGPITTANAVIHFLPGPYVADAKEGDALAELSPFGDIPVFLTIIGSGDYSNDPSKLAVKTTFTFLYAGDTPLVVDGVTYNTGANVLTVKNARLNFVGGDFDTAIYTSDFANLQGWSNTFQGGDIDFADAPVFHNVRYWPNADSYSTQVSGYFNAGVPEPATWAMMILGFGMIGVLTRKQRLAVA